MVTAEGVGSRYDVGINGVGYRIDRDPVSRNPYRRQTGVLTPPRFATGSTPFAEAADRYMFKRLVEIVGAGQWRYDQPSSDPQRVWRLVGADPWLKPGQVRLMGDGRQQTGGTDPSYTDQGPRSTVWWEELTALGWVGSKSGRKASWLQSASISHYTVPGSGTLYDLAVDSQGWWAAADDGLYGPTAYPSASIPGTPVNTLSWRSLDFVGDRLAGVYYDPVGDRTVWTTLNSSGVEEVSGGRWSQDGAVANSYSGVSPTVVENGHMFFAVPDRHAGVVVYAWDFSTAAPREVLRLPQSIGCGLTVGYGALYVSAWRVVEIASTSYHRLTHWRCPIGADGSLTPTVLREMDFVAGGGLSISDAGQVSGVADGRLVYLPHPYGVTIVDPASGGWGEDDGSWSSAARMVRGDFEGAQFWHPSNPGVYVARVRPEERDLTTGEFTLFTSQIDFATGEPKVWDKVLVSFDALTSGQSVSVSYTTDLGVSWTTPATSQGFSVGDTTVDADLGVTGEQIQFRVLVTGDVTFRGIAVKAHNLSLSDTLVEVPVLAYDRVKLGGGVPDPDAKFGRGAEIVRELEALVGSTVDFQDVDWQDGDPVERMDVMAVRLENRVAAWDTSRGRVGDGQVAVVQLRKAK